MAFDTFIAYVGVYPDVDSAQADYDLVRDLHYEAGLSLGGGFGLAAGLGRPPVFG